MAPGSSSASSSSSGSASPEPEIQPTKKGTIEKEKNAAPEKGRNKGDDPHWAYQPPRKSILLEASADVGDFDWDALKGNEDLELWLVRIPDGVKPKYLETAQLELPAAMKRDSKKTAKLGMLQRKHVGYDIWSIGDDAPEELPIGGEEIKAISCLLPRKSKKGKLYAAPTPIARTIVMSAQEVKPTPDPTNSTSPNARPTYKNPPRESHPKELLTHKFMPYGSIVESEPGRARTPMEIDSEPRVLVPETPRTEIPQTVTKVKGDKKSKKRKGEEVGESPKKPKKAKTTS
ncbi:hypothetical protein DFH07DRAFT_795997 [Mycena maculata]|uniref:Uncharacterized protein n=1 Tax=Mycena maculata TaxID=230809 RepID=A0AAD7K7P7_9AGAR|nr:hypothetical protein DFH07DRAFT_795997 [Mycena maculata]